LASLEPCGVGSEEAFKRIGASAEFGERAPGEAVGLGFFFAIQSLELRAAQVGGGGLRPGPRLMAKLMTQHAEKEVVVILVLLEQLDADRHLAVARNTRVVALAQLNADFAATRTAQEEGDVLADFLQLEQGAAQLGVLASVHPSRPALREEDGRHRVGLHATQRRSETLAPE
jgi:hypothetical protein